jgi:hypothetical protein
MITKGKKKRDRISTKKKKYSKPEVSATEAQEWQIEKPVSTYSPVARATGPCLKNLHLSSITAVTESAAKSTDRKEVADFKVT